MLFHKGVFWLAVLQQWAHEVVLLTLHVSRPACCSEVHCFWKCSHTTCPSIPLTWQPEARKINSEETELQILSCTYSWFSQHYLKYLHQRSVSLEKVAKVVSYGRWCKFVTNFHTKSDVFSVKGSSSANDRSSAWLSGWSGTRNRCLSFLDLQKQLSSKYCNVYAGSISRWKFITL
jgi:hypothetical protein